jgi:hypothetical protein
VGRNVKGSQFSRAPHSVRPFFENKVDRERGE